MFRILPLFLLVLISFIFSSDRKISNNQSIFSSNNNIPKIKFVQYNEDYKVKIVDDYESLGVEIITNVFYDSYRSKYDTRVNNKKQSIVQWTIVNKFMTADYKIKIVDTGEDFSIKYY